MDPTQGGKAEALPCGLDAGTRRGQRPQTRTR